MSALGDLAAKLSEQFTIGVQIETLTWWHGLDIAESGVLQTRQQLVGEFTIWRPLMTRRLYADLEGRKVDITELRGNLTILFLADDQLAKIEQPGTLLVYAGVDAPRKILDRLELHLFLPTPLFEVTRATKAISCTLAGLNRESGELADYHWPDPRKSLDIVESQFQQQGFEGRGG